MDYIESSFVVFVVFIVFVVFVVFVDVVWFFSVG